MPPFANQVSGRTPIFQGDEGVIYKLASEAEVKFYTYLQRHPGHALNRFVPEFHRMTRVSGKAILSAYKDAEQSSAPSMAPELADRISENVKKLRIASDKIYDFLVLQDLTYGMERPCVADIKLGHIQWTPNDVQTKMAAQRNRSENSTSHTLGFRISGMKVFRENSSSFDYTSKLKGREVQPNDMQQNIQKFFDNGNGLRTDVMQSVVRRLDSLIQTLAQERTWMFVAVSLLIIYDGKPDSCCTRLALIDFAKTMREQDIWEGGDNDSEASSCYSESPTNATIRSSSAPSTASRQPDVQRFLSESWDGVRMGLQNLKNVLECILQSKQYAAPKVAVARAAAEAAAAAEEEGRFFVSDPGAEIIVPGDRSTPPVVVVENSISLTATLSASSAI